jgi:hypothetical protein
MKLEKIIQEIKEWELDKESGKLLILISTI